MRTTEGQRFLDENFPGWKKWIDWENLNMDDPCGCILGQLYGNYHEAVEDLGFTDDEAVECGFLTNDDEDWVNLGDDWRNEVQ
jgi:hypothetical protein